ncbi:YuzD family protein [Listeria grayi]|uniref:YuzD family protein n=1 Tax=Listeria grayi TaxID=1641 RepID=UPI001817B488|nr:YuzD family protein [Listeria grayi]MBC1923071.1 DUF1462 family protein [Listeria grayi]
MTEAVTIYVYGSSIPCASCVGAPSSKETEEWLRAAIRRKFPEQSFRVIYVDIFDPPNQQETRQLAEKIVEEDYIYPVIVVDNEVVAEGNPRLKDIYAIMLDRGYIAQPS